MSFINCVMNVGLFGYFIRLNIDLVKSNEKAS